MSARKRRKMASEEPESNVQDRPYHIRDIAAEINLEIALKRREVEKLQSRIEWALLLQDSLQAVSHHNTNVSAPFKEYALDTLSTVEGATKISQNQSTAIPAQELKPYRPPVKYRPSLVRNPKTAFLYIHSESLDFSRSGDSNQVYLLKCPVCSRTTFTSLQGLLNHARISHGLEWGTHEECVRSCAVPDHTLDFTNGIEVGIASGGILPGLRSLFQMAVKANPGENVGLEQLDNEHSTTLLTHTLGFHEDTPALAPFLGKPLPERKIRTWDEEEDVQIDLEEEGRPSSNSTLEKPSRRMWRMHYAHRKPIQQDNLTPDDLQLDSVSVHPEKEESPTMHSHGHERKQKLPVVPGVHVQENADQVPAAVQGSRFHFAARIVVTDRSLWVPPVFMIILQRLLSSNISSSGGFLTQFFYADERVDFPNDHTHKWMISVLSPSYSHHITSILDRFHVTPLVDGDQLVPISAFNPPYVVVGTTNRPFLAKLELLFNKISGFGETEFVVGGDNFQTVTLEHWVDLDHVGSLKVVPGAEQVFDVELDRRTEMRPARSDYTPYGSKALWDLKRGESETSRSSPSNDETKRTSQEIPRHEQLLSKLVKNFPLTLKDTKGQKQMNYSVPYHLASNPAQLESFVPGRRKAVEWGRARALRDAYTLATEDTTSDILLQTGDVYDWLVENGYFPHISSSGKEKPKGSKGDLILEDTDVLEHDKWCRICGQIYGIHTAFAGALKQEIPSNERTNFTRDEIAPCQIAPQMHFATRFPLMNVLSPSGEFGETKSAPFTLAPELLLAASDPHLTLGIHDVIRTLDLPSFKSIHNSGVMSPISAFPVDLVGNDRKAIEENLAPYALLALATRSFIRHLVVAGLEAAKTNKDTLREMARLGRHKSSKRVDFSTMSVLTPRHIIWGVSTPTVRQPPERQTISWCLGRLGTVINFESSDGVQTKVEQ